MPDPAAPAEPPRNAEPEPAGWFERLFTFERRMLLLALAGALPGAVVGGVFLLEDPGGLLGGSLAVVLLAAAVAGAVLVERRLSYTLLTLANLLEALREGDFSLRPRAAFGHGPMGEVMREVAVLPEVLRAQRLEAREATVLLSRVIDAIDVAVFAFDETGHLQVVNRAGERLLARPGERLLGQSAGELGLADFLHGEPARLVDRSFPGRTARWDVRRSGFRKDGLPYRLVVLSDLSRPLREEERQAWKRLIRVLGHELNNSLAPIRSIADTLARLLHRDPRPDDWEEDARRSLGLISERSESLSRFMAAYSRLARLPPPRRREVALAPIVERAARLEDRVPVEIDPGPEVTVRADADQLEQALINLVRNAADATLEADGEAGSDRSDRSDLPVVRLGWVPTAGGVELRVEDSGPGLSNPDNLFVPFYTTKPQGTGIGLVLARQIAEGHGGTVSLENLPEGGCLARLRISGGRGAAR